MTRSATYAQLRSFNAVAREGSISKAARRLGLSQPAVTAQIRALEQAFGVLLFERTGHGARPTALGRRLYAETRGIGDIEDRARDILLASTALEFGELHLMCGAPNPAMQLIAEFRRLYPGVRVTADFGNWQEVTSALMNHRCDAIVLTASPIDDAVLSVPYAQQRIVALVPQGHRLANGRTEVSFKDLRSAPLIFRTEQSRTQRAVDEAFQRLGTPIEPALRLGAREAVFEAVGQGLGIGFAFELTVPHARELLCLNVSEINQIFTEDIACLSRSARKREVAALMELARSVS